MTTSLLSNKIINTEKLVFECNFGEVIKHTIDIVENIEKNIVFSNEENKQTWNQISYYLAMGLENKDYLVIADILEYELKPLLRSENLF
ncbi:hypothetical protein [Rubeoparvulum massiliense]|uniref:hypothetical protein n=1 Tax=Rubeoparvulum massiliense TaxID=1631346 RepID=UPI00065DD909|nr:hypothetical protein [Rubeoparvulum massiliense]